ncbi:MAG: 3-phosphoshikimate 1-carboxyvinyltransferase [Clostridia bacterium]|nr:3-phosphoshikimate 1-carboxyvinyltransferase [Clostridia bacterium]
MAVFYGSLSGTVSAMPSKSMSHRAIISASLCSGVSRINNFALSEDITATLHCVEALGAKTTLSENAIDIQGITAPISHALLPCGESGTTYRLLYPVASLIAEQAEFSLAPSLERRPMEPLISLLQSKGVKAAKRSVSGKYSHGDFYIAGNISSQFISGLIYALSMLDGESRIIPTTPVQSAGYIEMTRSCIHHFGGSTQWDDGTLIVRPAEFRPAEFTIPGDYSHAAMLLAAGAVYGRVTVTGLSPDPYQRDSAILDILSRMGANVKILSDSVTVCEGALIGTDVDASDTPDIVPAIAVAACAARGETRIFNASRLRLKESDRIAAIVQELSRLGADISETADGFIIHGGKKLRSARCCSHNDHRIAMMLMCMGGMCGGIELTDTSCIAKSAPQFLSEFTSLGGSIS